MNKFSDFIIFCSGANKRILENCPDERHKFYPIGLGVLITSALAFISMIIASNKVFPASKGQNEILLILFSIFWGIAIFSIDWGLIKTMRKIDYSNSSPWAKIIGAIPVIFRLFVAVIISFTVSKPLETYIYEKRLKAQIAQDRLNFITSEKSKKNIEMNVIAIAIDSSDAKINDIEDKISTGPQTTKFKNLKDDFNQTKLNLDATRKTNSGKISVLNNQINQINNNVNNYDSLGLKREFKVKVSNLKGQIRSLNNEIAALENLKGTINQEIISIEEDYNSKLETTKETYLDDKFFYKNERDSKKFNDSIELAKIIQSSYVSFDTINPGLITEIEAMSTLEKTPQGKSVKLVRIILLLMIICIDTAPILIKLLTKRGPYEEMHDQENERLIFLSRHETYLNKHLIQQLSLAQKEVLTESIRSWKEKEKSKENISSIYIKSNGYEN